MKQIIQSFKTGKTILEEVPAPIVSKGCVLIKTTHSLVSLGTERMLVEFGKSNIFSKARQQPEKVKQVFDKIKTEGILPTLETVFSKLEQPLPLGYCNVGQVIEVGEGINEFKIGDRVVSNGPHAEIVLVPQNLAVKIPDNVSDLEASFTVIGSIGLQGIRLINPTFGETIIVIGLGLIGLLTAQLLIANGCNVIGLDIDDDKLNLAKSLGIKTCNSNINDSVKYILDSTLGNGADGVIITASSKSNEIVSNAAQMSRKRGRIVLVGVVGLELNRSEFYEKELSFQVSCSYGPGRYDDNYEQKGIDYPLPFVRWTEKRNFESVLQSISNGRLLVKDLITEIVPLEKFNLIYDNIGNSKSIASILQYPTNKYSTYNKSIKIFDQKFDGQKGVIGIIGAGNFTKMTMLPALKGSGAILKYIASRNGLTSTILAKKYGFNYSTTNYLEILRDDQVDLVFITTRHNQHAMLVKEALEYNKHVFVEKPLALNKDELEILLSSLKVSKGSITVGFNRRFSAHIQKIKENIGQSPINIIATMNAGYIPPESWIQDMNVGGGRIIGEACHYIDLCTYLTGSPVISVCMNALGIKPTNNTDNASILLKFENGSNAVINYFSNGSKAYPKERLEIYSQGKTIVLDNFIKTKAYGFKNFRELSTNIDKGHKKQFKDLIQKIKQGGKPIIPIESLINTTITSFAALESLREQKWIDVQCKI